MGKNIRSFAGCRLTFAENGMTLAGFGGCVWNFFLESQDSQSLHFSVLECSREVSAYHDKFIVF